MIIVLQAVPSVRMMCPESYLEGEWREVPDETKTIKLGAAVMGFDGAGPHTALVKTVLVAKPSGRMMRRDSDGATAPVWEVRHPDDW